jgi:hypothetical protein
MHEAIKLLKRDPSQLRGMDSVAISEDERDLAFCHDLAWRMNGGEPDVVKVRASLLPNDWREQIWVLFNGQDGFRPSWSRSLFRLWFGVTLNRLKEAFPVYTLAIEREFKDYLARTLTAIPRFDKDKLKEYSGRDGEVKWIAAAPSPDGKWHMVTGSTKDPTTLVRLYSTGDLHLRSRQLDGIDRLIGPANGQDAEIERPAPPTLPAARLPTPPVEAATMSLPRLQKRNRLALKGELDYSNGMPYTYSIIKLLFEEKLKREDEACWAKRPESRR